MGNLMGRLLQKAHDEQFAIAQPNFVNIDMAATYLEAGVQSKSPIILGYGEEYLKMSSATNLKHLVQLIETLSKGYETDVVLHLDHGSSFEMCKKALEAGFTSVMIDGSALPFEENIQLTKKVVDLAKQTGAVVEGELGQLKTGRGYDLVSNNEESLTDPVAAKEFVIETGVHSLAVSVGTVHGDFTGTPHIDMELLEEINNQVKLPLVLHGASGIPLNKLAECAQLGVTKINVFTDFTHVIFNTLHEEFEHRDDLRIPELLALLKQNMTAKMLEYIHALGSNSKNIIK